jgi:type I restriction enzyme M protein
MATVLANGSLSSKSSGEGEIRKNLVEADLVECIVTMPDRLFYTTGIPVCVWFLTKDKSDRKIKSERHQRNRQGETLFIDASQLGAMSTRTVRELSDADIAQIAGTFHAWRGEFGGDYIDVPGFCASVKLEDIRTHGHVLNPGRYVGAADAEGDDEPLEDKLTRVSEVVRLGFGQRATLQEAVSNVLNRLSVVPDE